MRDDSIGMFWQDIPEARARGAVVRPMPPIPETGWVAPRELPNLRAARVLSIDTETWDPNLLTHGPGWARNDGHMVGMSVCTEDGHAWYLPMRHTVQGEHNLDPEAVLRWARDMLGDARQPKIGANLLYDVGWLRQEGVNVAGDLYDVQFAEALLNESARTSLDSLAQKYLGLHKETEELYQWCSLYYGEQPTERQRKNIHRAPPCLVGPYAEADAVLPMGVIPHQTRLLREQGLYELFRMECQLIPLLVEMRFRGVRVDIAAAERVRDTLAADALLLQAQLRDMVGFDVNVNAADSLAKAFDALGVSYNRTAPSARKPDGSPSFTKEFLEQLEHPVGDLVRGIRGKDKLRTVFIESYVLNNHVNGRVHCQFHPLRGDDGGTRSGRFSSSDPNLQNIPSRDPILAPLVRGIFIPEEGCLWTRQDYSQIEYRGLVHYAVGPGADEARARYHSDPKTDYHEFTLDLVAPVARWDVTTAAQRKHHRKPLKNINFGLVYGMGEPKLARSLGLDKRQGRDLFDGYHAALPFVRATMEATAEEAARLGYITTVLGRRSRFDLWEPADRKRGAERSPGLPYDLAVREYGMVQRAYLHKALNRRLQGTAADVMKAAMLRAWQDGVFAVIGAPHVTVHDELGTSDDGDPAKRGAWQHLDHILQTCIPLRVPITADTEVGPDWGHVA